MGTFLTRLDSAPGAGLDTLVGLCYIQRPQRWLAIPSSAAEAPSNRFEASSEKVRP